MIPVCPYCNSEMDAADLECLDCPSCGGSHHRECWLENGGCTVFGCASAPGDGPVVTVDESDISLAVPPPPQPSQMLAAFVAPPPPPLPQATRYREPELSLAGYNQPTQPSGQGPIHAYAGPPKERLTFVLLGVFLGAFGAHNFYAGYHGRGTAQVAITLCTLFAGSLISWIWAVVEVCVVTRDKRNVSMV